MGSINISVSKQKPHLCLAMEDSMMQSVYHKDYIISMYEILGNSQNLKQFQSKYHNVFSFMINRYLKQVVAFKGAESIKKIVFTLKAEKNRYLAIDFSEKERHQATARFISPIKENPTVTEYANILASSKV